jgi:hypothetical protein
VLIQAHDLLPPQPPSLAMAYAKWKNDAGANFDTGLLCRWMEPPQEGNVIEAKGIRTVLLVNLGWHACAD